MLSPSFNGNGHTAADTKSVAVSQAPTSESPRFDNGKKYQVMVRYLHQKLLEHKWIESNQPHLGTFVRRSDGSYARTTSDSSVLHLVETVAAPVVFTMSCDAVSVLLEETTVNMTSITFTDGTVLPVATSVLDVHYDRSFARNGFYACLCRKESFILVAASTPSELLAQSSTLESNCVGRIWGSTIVPPAPALIAPVTPTRTSSIPGRVTHYKPDLSSYTFGMQTSVDDARRSFESDSRTTRRFSNTPYIREPSPQDMVHVIKPPKIRHRYSHSEGSGIPTPSTPRRASHHALLTPQMRRSRSIGYRSQSPSSLKFAPKLSISRVPEGIVPQLQPLPPRKTSALPDRSQSFSSIFLGDTYRGSVSEEVSKKVEFIEHCMELEETGEHGDVEIQRTKKRPFVLVHACLVALATVLVVTLDFWCVAKLVSESRLDGSWARWALLITVPFFTAFSLFFAIVISGSFFQLVGPLGALTQNSQFYSAVQPKISEHAGEELPHITIQMPVYKEGLKGVIMPTINSVVQAVKYYQAHGGTATIYVCDDGMQLISPELQEARKVFYELHNIAWCARPKQNTSPGPDFFLRRGKFKKASNLNYGLDFSLRVEDEFLRVMEQQARAQGRTTLSFTPEEEIDILEDARITVEQTDNGRTWSAGDVRIGEFILLIDSDTVVPEDCLLAGALEMMESEQVAVIQHSSGVMNMTHNTFENGITYFTNLIYTSITHAVGSGDVAPFVGHNAFLRWKAIQSIAFQEDGKTKFWSEHHVSEDFDVALRLQMEHFVVRLAGYHQGGFKEGVSLTVYDELSRWEKYAYGCNELIFHPIIQWPRKGIFTPLFIKFLRSNIKITSKFSILSYIWTYYAIAVGFPLSVMNYVLGGLEFQLDHFYQTSFRILVGLCVVYNLLSPIAFAMLRYRMGQTSYIRAVLDCIKWTPLFMIFFGGLSFHISKALLCHFFSINIEWTTTAKELEKTGFKIGLDRVFRDFWPMYMILLPMIGGMVYLGVYSPFGWRITDFTVITPLANQIVCHAILPFALGLF